MAEKFLLFSLDDEKSKKLGEIISNPTCKKIVNALAERELSEQDISHELNLPLNTTEYNLNKLIEAGIVEKSKAFFWSSRGKKIPTYKIANKLIVISPKPSAFSKLKTILPLVIISAIFTALLVYMQKASELAILAADKASDNLLQASGSVSSAGSSLSAGIASTKEVATQTASRAAPALNSVLQGWQIALIAIWAIIVAWIAYVIIKRDK